MSIYIFERKKRPMFNMMKMLLLFGGRGWGPDPSATSPFADGSLSGHVLPNGVAGQGSGLGSVWRGRPCSSSNGR